MVLQDNIRVAAGGCVGSLALIVPEPELESIINDQLIGMINVTARRRRENTIFFGGQSWAGNIPARLG